MPLGTPLSNQERTVERNATGTSPRTAEDLRDRVETLERQVDDLLEAFALMAAYRTGPPRPERHLSVVS